jgi:hypothetical protein
LIVTVLSPRSIKRHVVSHRGAEKLPCDIVVLDSGAGNGHKVMRGLYLLGPDPFHGFFTGLAPAAAIGPSSSSGKGDDDDDVMMMMMMMVLKIRTRRRRWRRRKRGRTGMRRRMSRN